MIWLLTTFYAVYYYDVGAPRTYGGVMCTGYMIKVGVTGFFGSLLVSMLFVGNYAGLTSVADSGFTLAYSMLMAILMHIALWPRIKLLPLYFSETTTFCNFVSSFL